MITLYGFGAGFGLPEISPYVTKTEVQLKVAGLEYIKAVGDRDQSPKGQMPYIDDGDERIGDSTFIRWHIEHKYGLDLDAALSPDERADAWAYERMIENQFNWACGHFRWLDPDNFARGPARFADGAPEAARPAIRQQLQDRVREGMRVGGVSRHAEVEILMLADRSLCALSRRLGSQPYLMGDRACGLDATAFGVLAGILTPYFNSPLRRQAEGFANLADYVDRMMAEHYPQFAWRTAQAA